MTNNSKELLICSVKLREYSEIEHRAGNDTAGFLLTFLARRIETYADDSASNNTIAVMNTAAEKIIIELEKYDLRETFKTEHKRIFSEVRDSLITIRESDFAFSSSRYKLLVLAFTMINKLKEGWEK